ncbi:hypothetical protein AC1031_005224 [Aphanomyces cochlioides]|nr:hypothetical protein AC1031_005224 [Aphanomyces cochlioides]
MGHKSYVSPADDDVSNSDVHGPVRRKGSDQVVNERTPLTETDRKKDRPMPWVKQALIRRSAMVFVLAVVLVMIYTNWRNAPQGVEPPSSSEVDHIQQELVELDAEGAPDPIVGKSDDDKTLHELLERWNLPLDSVDTRTHNEWVVLYNQMHALAQGNGEAKEGLYDEADTPAALVEASGDSNPDKLVDFQRILALIRRKLDEMRSTLDESNDVPTEGTTGPPPVPQESAPPSAPQETAPPPVPQETAPPSIPQETSPETTAPMPSIAEKTEPPSQHPAEVESAPSTAAPIMTPVTLMATETTAIPSQTAQQQLPTLEYQKGLQVWLQADNGVDFVAPCTAESAQCFVKQWKNSAGRGDGGAFLPANLADPTTFPVWVRGVQNGQPIVKFTCPMIWSHGTLLHDHMTLFFVLSPSRRLGDDEVEKFFGHAPYGQFRFRGGRAGYFGMDHVDAADVQGISPGAFSVLTYKLDNTVHVQVNGKQTGNSMALNVVIGMGFGSETSVNSAVQFSTAETTVLGNVKAICDASTLQGRIAEVLVYDAVLPDAAIDVVQIYLRQKWSIPQGTEHHSLAYAAAATTTARPVQATATYLRQTTTLQPLEEEEPPSLPLTSSASPATPRGPYNPDDVFKWTPPGEVDPELVAKWKAVVSEKIRLVERFQYGGQVLHDYIDQLKDELNSLRDTLFS